jgi:2-oxoisovalerate dehydrogenase E1 component
VAETIVTAIVECCGTRIPVQRVTGEDTYIPLGPAANLVLPSEQDIVTAAQSLTSTTAPSGGQRSEV